VVVWLGGNSSGKPRVVVVRKQTLLHVERTKYYLKVSISTSRDIPANEKGSQFQGLTNLDAAAPGRRVENARRGDWTGAPGGACVATTRENKIK
jgi:hypothetical protein